MRHVRSLLFALVAAAAVVGLLLGGASRGLAQDAGQQGSPVPTPAVPNHPVALHQGTCQQPTPEPAFDLGSTAPFSNEQGTVVPQTELRGTLTAPPLLLSRGNPEVRLDDLLNPAQPYVVIVHESPQTFQTYLACGEVGGAVVDNRLVIGIRPLNNSGYAGTATFEADGDNRTAGTVYLMSQVLAFQGGQAGPTPTPAAPPTPVPTFAATATLTPAPTMTPVPPTVVSTVVSTVVTTVVATATPAP